MLVIAPIVVIAISVFVGLLLSMSNEAAKTQLENKSVYKVQDALDTIERDVRLTSRFLAGNEFYVARWQKYNYDGTTGPTNSYTNIGPRGNMLILRTVTTDRNPLNPDRMLVYNNDAPVGDSNPRDDPVCAPDKLLTNSFNTVNIVYFVRDIGDGKNSLWRRVLVNSNDSTCLTGAWQKGSCSPTTTDSECPAKDIRLVDDVSNFTIDYYLDSNSSSPHAVPTNPAHSGDTREAYMKSMNAVNVSITANSTVGGKPVEHTASIRTARMNVPQSD